MDLLRVTIEGDKLHLFLYSMHFVRSHGHCTKSEKQDAVSVEFEARPRLAGAQRQRRGLATWRSENRFRRFSWLW